VANDGSKPNLILLQTMRGFAILFTKITMLVIPPKGRKNDFLEATTWD
jgi:hypothetical protein